MAIDEPKAGWLLWLDKIAKHTPRVSLDVETKDIERRVFEVQYGCNFHELSFANASGVNPFFIYGTPASARGQPPQDGFGGMWSRHIKQPATFIDKPEDKRSSSDHAIGDEDVVIEMVIRRPKMKTCPRCAGLYNQEVLGAVYDRHMVVEGASCPFCFYPKARLKRACPHTELRLITQGEHRGKIGCNAPGCNALFGFRAPYDRYTPENLLWIKRGPDHLLRGELDVWPARVGREAFLVAIAVKNPLASALNGVTVCCSWVQPLNREALPPVQGWPWNDTSMMCQEYERVESLDSTEHTYKPAPRIQGDGKQELEPPTVPTGSTSHIRVNCHRCNSVLVIAWPDGRPAHYDNRNAVVCACGAGFVLKQDGVLTMQRPSGTRVTHSYEKVYAPLPSSCRPGRLLKEGSQSRIQYFLRGEQGLHYFRAGAHGEPNDPEGKTGVLLIKCGCGCGSEVCLTAKAGHGAECVYCCTRYTVRSPRKDYYLVEGERMALNGGAEPVPKNEFSYEMR